MYIMQEDNAKMNILYKRNKNKKLSMLARRKGSVKEKDTKKVEITA